jgi:type IV fimbrial biogenesis protein FimT
MKRRNLGFTLIELIVTMAIAAIILTIGVPAFRDMILNNTRVALVNEVVGALSLARSEAAKSGLRATICRSVDGATCATDTPGVWENGWIIYVDRNQDNALSSGEAIKVQGSIPQGFTLRGTGSFSQTISYSSNGVSSGTGIFQLCDSRRENQSRLIEVNNTGRIKAQEWQSGGPSCPP